MRFAAELHQPSTRTYTGLSDLWQVSFLEYDLGYFDRDQDRVEPGPNPFDPDTVLRVTGIHPV
jgi:hypothetical protein